MESEVRKRVLISKGVKQDGATNLNVNEEIIGLISEGLSNDTRPIISEGLGLPSDESVSRPSSMSNLAGIDELNSNIESINGDSYVKKLNSDDFLCFQEDDLLESPDCNKNPNVEEYHTSTRPRLSLTGGVGLDGTEIAFGNHEQLVENLSSIPVDVGLPVAENTDRISLNGCIAPDLSFREVPETAASKRKVRKIEDVLSKTPVNVQRLRKLAMSEGGLINDNIRKRAWSKLVGIDNIPPLQPLSEKELEANGEYNQVVLDVNRSLKRFPPGIPYDQRVVLQDQLTRLIMRVIIKHPHLRYYQGYHDVAVTVLLVVGEEAAFPIMETLSTGHLSECMAETMDKTSYLLNYIYPLIRRMHPKLYDYMEKSGCGTLFCLPWYLTWFGHNLNHYTDVVRLYDYFMSTDKLLPLYLAAAMVVYRSDEVFNVECDMPYIHSLLSNIPDDLPFEKLLIEANELYKKFPPQSIEAEVKERVRLSQLPPSNSHDQRIRKQVPIRNILQMAPRMGRYSIFIATATLVVGLYAYIRTASALDVDSLFPIR